MFAVQYTLLHLQEIGHSYDTTGLLLAAKKNSVDSTKKASHTIRLLHRTIHIQLHVFFSRQYLPFNGAGDMIKAIQVYHSFRNFVSQIVTSVAALRNCDFSIRDKCGDCTVFGGSHRPMPITVCLIRTMIEAVLS